MNADFERIKSAAILIASASGRLYALEDPSADLVPVFNEGEFLMGLAEQGGAYYLAGHQRMYKITASGVEQTRKLKPRPGFHHLHIFHDQIHATATGLNEIWVFNLDMTLLHRVTIRPPISNRKIRPKYNYNHVNNIFLHGGRYYVCLNWLTNRQYGPSGVAVLDGGYRELDRFEYSWQSHAFSIIGNQKYTLCAAAADKHTRIPNKAGLLVDGELVFEHDPEKIFCKDFSIDSDHIMVVGGEASKRIERAHRSGFIYVLDRDFNLLLEREFAGAGAFTGVLFPRYDLTRPWSLSEPPVQDQAPVSP